MKHHFEFRGLDKNMVVKAHGKLSIPDDVCEISIRICSDDKWIGHLTLLLEEEKDENST